MLTTAFFKASAIIIPAKIMMAATINLGIKIITEAIISDNAFMPIKVVAMVININKM